MSNNKDLNCFVCGKSINDPNVLDDHDFSYFFPESAWELGVSIERIEKQLDKQASNMPSKEESEDIRKHGPLMVPVCPDCMEKSKHQLNCFVCGDEIKLGPSEEPELSFLLPNDAKKLDIAEERIRWETEPLERLEESPYFTAPERIVEEATNQGLLVVPICEDCSQKATNDFGIDYLKG